VTCTTCGGEDVPFRWVTGVKTYRIVQRHRAPCGEWCVHGLSNGPPLTERHTDNKYLHGPLHCPSGCAVPVAEWRKGTAYRSDK
jgi:hypothetical protein